MYQLRINAKQKADTAPGAFHWAVVDMAKNERIILGGGANDLRVASQEGTSALEGLLTPQGAEAAATLKKADRCIRISRGLLARFPDKPGEKKTKIDMALEGLATELMALSDEGLDRIEKIYRAPQAP